MIPATTNTGDTPAFAPPPIPDPGGSLNLHLLDRQARSLSGLALCYLGEKLSPEDKAVIYARGEHGAPLFDEECAKSLTDCIYRDPPGTGSVHAPAYYSPWTVEKAEREINLLKLKLPLRSLAGKEKAETEQAIQELRNTQEIQIERPRTQMRRLLEESKLIFTQREIDGEAQVVETVQIIDAVLRNMEVFGEPSKSANDPVRFHELYASTIKNYCERAVGRARNPWLLLNAFLKPRSENDSLDQRWGQGMEAAARQARTMAEQLKSVLSPFAGISPSSQKEFDVAIHIATQKALFKI